MLQRPRKSVAAGMGMWCLGLFRWLLFAALVCLQTPSNCQQFNRRYDPLGQHEGQFAWSVEVNEDATVLCIGAAPWTDSVAYGAVIATILINDSGNLLQEDRWEYVWRGSSPGWSNGSDRVDGTSYCIGGGTADSTGTIRLALFLMADNGDQQWISEHGMDGEFWTGRQAKSCPDGGYIVVGETGVNGSNDACLIKFDSVGNVLWTQIFGYALNDYAMAVGLTPDGYIVGGETHLSVDNGDFWVFRTDSLGDIRWERIWGTPEDEPNAHLQTTSDGHVVIASGLNDINAEMWPYMIKLDSADGSTIWEHTYGNAAYNTTFFAVKELAQGDLIAVGQSRQLTNDVYSQGMLLRTNNQGDSLWMRHYYYADSLMSDGLGTLRDVEPTPDGGFVAVGATWSSASGNNPPQYNQDMWVLKVDSMGCLVPGCDGIGTISSQITNLRDALSVAPNPAHSTAQLSWQLPRHLAKGTAQLSVVQGNGAVVLTEQLDLSRGTHALDVSGMAPGLYYVHMVQGTTWVSGCKLMVE